MLSIFKKRQKIEANEQSESLPVENPESPPVQGQGTAAILEEKHKPNPYDKAIENQSFQTEYDNAQEYFRKRLFVERFKKYMLFVRGFKGLFHVVSALSLGVGGIYSMYNFLFSDADRNDTQTWIFVGIGLVLFVGAVIFVEVAKGHFLGASMKNRFEAKNRLLGENFKPSLGYWATFFVAISLVGSVGFGFLSTYYLATDKRQIDTTYHTEVKDAKEELQRTNKDTKAHYTKQIESLYNQINEVNADIANSCPSCYTMRRKMRTQIEGIQANISQLEAKQREALASNKADHKTALEGLQASNESTLQDDERRASGRGWILGALTFFSDSMIVFLAFFIAMYNDRLFKEANDIGAIQKDVQPRISLEGIYANNMIQKHVQFLQMGGGQLLLDGGANGQLFLPTNQAPTALVIERKKRKKKKKKKNKKEERNPIGFSQAPSGKTDIEINAKKEAKNGQNSEDEFSQKKVKNSPNSLPKTEKDDGKDLTQVFTKNMLLNLNPETPYNLEKTYDLSKSVKKQISQLRKAYLNFVKNHSKRPTLAELDRSFSGMSKPTIRKYISMMEKEGQKLLRGRGELM